MHNSTKEMPSICLKPATIRRNLAHHLPDIRYRDFLLNESGKVRDHGPRFVIEEASIGLQALDGRDLHGNQVKVNYVAVRPRKDSGVYKLPISSSTAVDLVSDRGKKEYLEIVIDQESFMTSCGKNSAITINRLQYIVNTSA
ncbi:hypothetical protein OROGR_015260 [Orobanche gracilis]